MSSPLFTIIIPTLNEEKCLPRILINLSRQKIKNFEVIIVDCFSNDKTKEIAVKFNQIIPLRFYQVQKKNVSFQRNYGARKAKSKYLIFLDADAQITQLFTKKLEKIINRDKGLILIPSIIPEERTPQMRIMFKITNLLIEISQNSGKPFSSGGSLIAERNFFILSGGFPENVYLGEDHGLIQNAATWGVRAKFLRSVRVTFSLRRMKREGELKILYKYLLAAAHILIKGKVDSKIFEYEMGGQLYKGLNKRMSPDEILNKYLKQVKSFFNKVF